MTRPDASNKTYVNVDSKEAQSARRVSKEYWNPNGSAGSGDAAPATPDSDRASNSSPDAAASEKEFSRAARPPSKQDVSPAPRKRFEARRTTLKRAGVLAPYAQVNKNQNNNMKPPVKPRSLAVTANIAHKSRKLLTSVRDNGRHTSAASVRYARKILPSPTVCVC